jgi:lia operon protein LiaG
MKKSVLVGTVLLLAGIIGLLSTFSSGKDFFSFGTKELNLSSTVDASQVKSIKVNGDSANVNVVRGNSDKILITLAGKVSPKYADKIDLRTDVTGGILTVEPVEPNGFSIGISILDIALTVELPAKMWDTLAIKAGSGDIKVESLEAGGVTVDLGSGNTEMSAVNAGTIRVSTNSGDQRFEDLQSRELTVSVDSGNVTAHKFQADSISVKAGSGDLKLTDGQGELIGKTGSGNIRIESKQLSHNAKLEAGSGDITVLVDDQPQSLAFDFRTGSGDSHIDWSYTTDAGGSKDEDDVSGTFGSGDVKLDVKTGSGNIKLSRR